MQPEEKAGLQGQIFRTTVTSPLPVPCAVTTVSKETYICYTSLLPVPSAVTTARRSRTRPQSASDCHLTNPPVIAEKKGCSKSADSAAVSAAAFAASAASLALMIGRIGEVGGVHASVSRVSESGASHSRGLSGWNGRRLSCPAKGLPSGLSRSGLSARPPATSNEPPPGWRWSTLRFTLRGLSSWA